MLKPRWIICLFMVAIGLEGCEWKSDLYQEYVNEKDGSIESCYGVCMKHQIKTEAECLTPEVGGIWNPGVCYELKRVIGEDGKETGQRERVEVDSEKCNNQEFDSNKFEWEEGVCTIKDQEKCIHKADGQWAEYHMLDLGDGLYIRKIIHADNSEQFICGSYALVITNSQNASSCKEEDIQKFIQAQKYQLCPGGTTCQLAYQQEIEGEGNTPGDENTEKEDNLIAICSSCPQNSIMCRNPQGEFVCTYIESDAENCGECGEKCGENFRCEHGECKQNLACEHPSKLCYINGEEVCLSASNPETCGVKDCDITTGERCEVGFDCLDKYENNKFQCVCPSGIEIINEGGGKECISPDTNEHCGATMDNPNGNKCHAGKECKNVNGIYRCTCSLSWELPCYHEDGIHVDCVDPNYSMQYCGASACTDTEKEKHACLSSEVCHDGDCICRDGYVKCDGQCINPEISREYCGASGTCDSTTDQLNSIGEKCSEYRICKEKRCVCMEGYVEYEGQCVHPSEASKCGIKVVEAGYEFEDCTLSGASCKLISKEEGYACQCPSGQIMCDKQCVDPNSNVKYCGAKENCIGDNRGSECDLENPICYDGNCVFQCPDGQTECFNTCVFIDSSTDHCGECGNKCDGEHGIFVCKQKTCELVACENGWGNCNGDSSDGCEFNIAQDKNNCGLCGNKCEFANAVTACVEGRCQIVECEQGFIDCDGNIQNGCEVDVQNDIENCGGCNNKCSLINAPSICLNGNCIIKDNICYTGYGNCDSSDLTGCEQDLRDSLEHCGGCFEKCEYPFATSVCSEGNCFMGECHGGYHNCDDERENGCEINIMQDINNCGSCGKKCEYSHATAMCKDGNCGIETCETGYAHCDNNIENGCETNITTTQNCGSCGNICTEGKICNTGNCCYPTDKRVKPKITSKSECCNPADHVWYKSSSCSQKDGCYACSVNKPSSGNTGWKIIIE